jgi:hypothetical protein
MATPQELDQVFIAVMDVASSAACRAAAASGYEAVVSLVSRSVHTAVAALEALPDRSELSVDQSTPYRLSPNGTLAGRTNPGWRVLVSKDPHLHWGQDLTDQHVAAWSPLIRKGATNVG